MENCVYVGISLSLLICVSVPFSLLFLLLLLPSSMPPPPPPPPSPYHTLIHVHKNKYVCVYTSILYIKCVHNIVEPPKLMWKVCVLQHNRSDSLKVCVCIVCIDEHRIHTYTPFVCMDLYTYITCSLFRSHSHLLSFTLSRTLSLFLSLRFGTILFYIYTLDDVTRFGVYTTQACCNIVGEAGKRFVQAVHDKNGAFSHKLTNKPYSKP